MPALQVPGRLEQMHFAEFSISFCPETAIFRNFCVNLQASLCGERMFASAPSLDFLDFAENISFPNQQLHSFSSLFPDETN